MLKAVDLNFYKDLDLQSLKSFVTGVQKGQKIYGNDEGSVAVIIRSSIDPLL
tara:strand:+ start:66 stop:221 length:156 start_codon:yes stop_codon:yes gene_type:complete